MDYPNMKFDYTHEIKEVASDDDQGGHEIIGNEFVIKRDY